MDFRDPVLIPLPTTDDEFERICMLIARERYGPEFYRYGRSGQAQHGIDIYSAYYNGRCLQCKLHKKDISDANLVNELKKDIYKAKQKFKDMRQFIVAISVETRPAIQDVCHELSDDRVHIIPWFWNQLQEDIARSKWLLRYCLNYEVGAQWINDDFAEQEGKKGDALKWQPLQFYSSNLNLQWYGLLQNWDAPRQCYSDIKKAVTVSFNDPYNDMPVAAVVRGEGGSGKSVLLRRLALDLRNEYTIYWIADNATDFLHNEWIYDIENHPNEKYLLVLEDWYRNFSSTNSKTTALHLLQKIKRKPNVRLLIGDRPAQYTYYPSTNSNIFELKSDENPTLFSHIINVIPAWKNKFIEEQKIALLKTGFFQALFVYQYAENGKSLPKAENYFQEIINVDYKKLSKREASFFKGFAYALYAYAHIYTDLGIYLTTEALITLAEDYSGSQRPYELTQDINNIIEEPIVRRYLEIINKSTLLFGELNWIRFLHDTLADQGWKSTPIDKPNVFGTAISIVRVLDALKSKTTAFDFGLLLYQVLTIKQGLLTKSQVAKCCEYMLESKVFSTNLASVLFKEGLTEFTDEERIGFIQRLTGLANHNYGFWVPVLVWISRSMKYQDRKDTLRRLVDAGNDCDNVLAEYFRLLSESELKEKISEYLTENILANPTYQGAVSVLLKRSELDNNHINIIRKYLQSPYPEKATSNFNVCLKILKEEDVARDAARKYLQSPYPEKESNNFTVCLKILKGEDVARDAARKYLQSLYPEKVSANFTVCLKLLKEEDVARGVARKYIQSPDSKKAVENFIACLTVLGSEVADVVAEILKSSIKGQDHRVIYRALQIASETENLDVVAEAMVRRILDSKLTDYDNNAYKKYNLYLQIMKIPLFRVSSWKAEVDKVLQNGVKIQRNLLYSLTISHIKRPEPLSETCILIIRNWTQEFKREKKHWSYFIRCLAHPIIQNDPTLQNEIGLLCQQMLLSNDCPSQVRTRLQLIAEVKEFPLWDIAGKSLC